MVIFTSTLAFIIFKIIQGYLFIRNQTFNTYTGIARTKLISLIKEEQKTTTKPLRHEGIQKLSQDSFGEYYVNKITSLIKMNKA